MRFTAHEWWGFGVAVCERRVFGNAGGEGLFCVREVTR